MNSHTFDECTRKKEKKIHSYQLFDVANADKPSKKVEWSDSERGRQSTHWKKNATETINTNITADKQSNTIAHTPTIRLRTTVAINLNHFFRLNDIFHRYFYFSFRTTVSFFFFLSFFLAHLCVLRFRFRSLVWVCMCVPCVCYAVVLPVYPSYPVIVCCSSDQPSNVCNILFGYFVFFHFSFTVIVVTLTAAAIPMLLYTERNFRKYKKNLI